MLTVVFQRKMSQLSVRCRHSNWMLIAPSICRCIMPHDLP